MNFLKRFFSKKPAQPKEKSSVRPLNVNERRIVEATLAARKPQAQAKIVPKK